MFKYYFRAFCGRSAAVSSGNCQKWIDKLADVRYNPPHCEDECVCYVETDGKIVQYSKFPFIAPIDATEKTLCHSEE